MRAVLWHLVLRNSFINTDSLSNCVAVFLLLLLLLLYIASKATICNLHARYKRFTLNNKKKNFKIHKTMNTWKNDERREKKPTQHWNAEYLMLKWCPVANSQNIHIFDMAIGYVYITSNLSSAYDLVLVMGVRECAFFHERKYRNICFLNPNTHTQQMQIKLLVEIALGKLYECAVECTKSAPVSTLRAKLSEWMQQKKKNQCSIEKCDLLRFD